MLQELIGQMVVVDLRSPYVCLGMLTNCDDTWLEMRKADLHDLRDTHTSRENYVAEARTTGIRKNRKRLLLARQEVVGIAQLDDVIEG